MINNICVYHSLLDVLYDDFLFASDANLDGIFQFNLSDPNLGYSALQLDSRVIQNPVALAYDPVKAQVLSSLLTWMIKMNK